MTSDGVVVTKGGRLPFKIVHLQVPNDMNASEKEWKEAMKRALLVAEKERLRSLSIPAIGTGAYEYNCVIVTVRGAQDRYFVRVRVGVIAVCVSSALPGARFVPGGQSRSSGEIASAMLDSIAEFAIKDSPTSLKRVRIVIYSAPHQLAHFQEALQKKVDDIKSGHSGYRWLKVRAHSSTVQKVLVQS